MFSIRKSINSYGSKRHSLTHLQPTHIHICFYLTTNITLTHIIVVTIKQKIIVYNPKNLKAHLLFSMCLFYFYFLLYSTTLCITYSTNG